MLGKYINPYKKLTWITLSIIIKILVCLYLYNIKVNSENVTHYFAISGGDTFSYFGSIDHLIKDGNYTPFYRMPGVGAVYFVFRLFFTQSASINLFVFFQIALDVLACYALSLLAFQISKSRLFFIITYILAVTNSYYGVFDLWLLSESICTSTIIFSVYFLYQSIYNSKKIKYFLLSGFFIAWTIFCRPVYIPVLVIYVIVLMYNLYSDKRLLFKSIIVLCLPFVIFDAIWVFSGYQHDKKIFILQHSNYEINKKDNKNQEAYQTENWKIGLVKYVQAFGGDVVDWNPDADIAWFNTNTGIKNKINHLPRYAFTNTINEDSLLEIKKGIEIINQPTIEKGIKDSIKNNIELRLMRFTKNYKDEKPIHYYFISRIIILKKLLFHQATYNLFQKPYSELSRLNKGIKIYYLLIYYVYLVGFFLSFFLIILNRKIHLFLPIILVALFGILIYPALKYCEYRYIVPVVPFMLFLSSYSIYSIISLLINKNGKNTLS